MKHIKRILARLHGSAVFWSGAFQGIRLASGIFLLPLLLRKLPTEDLGMYWVFASLIALIPIIDFGFSAAIARFVSYAMAGATTLQATGLVPSSESQSGPNYPLLWKLLAIMRKLYGCLALAGFVLMGTWGTFLVHAKAPESFDPQHTWWAWGITLLAAVFEIYSNWWNTYLYCINHVSRSSRIAFFAYALRILLACGLLLLGGGLLSMPLASLFGILLNRTLSRRACLKLLGDPPPAELRDTAGLFAIIWPNSWRQGLQLVSGYLKTNANTAICAMALGLTTTAEYGLSTTVMLISLGMANVWIGVKWPQVGQYRTRQDFAGLRQMLRPRLWLQSLTFIVLVTIAIIAGPWLLQWIGTDKKLLPTSWLVLIALNTFLEMQFTVWGTIIATENRLPFLWTTIATNVFSLILSIVLIQTAALGVGALVLAPLLTGVVFNYWYWPLAGARSIKTKLFPYLFAREAA